MRASGLVLLLPHGYDGAGPDHSSAKPERFLQLVDSQAWTRNHHVVASSSSLSSGATFEPPPPAAATHSSLATDVNLCIVNLTTPANYFHVLRRQQCRPFRKPVVVMAPKTLLRLAVATSALRDIGPGTHFEPVLGDRELEQARKTTHVSRVMLVSGKYYYDLVHERNRRHRFDTAIVRIEELAPFPYAAVQAELNRYRDDTSATQLVWVQEEPANQGAWSYIRPHVEALDLRGYTPTIHYIGRKALPASAVGLSRQHACEVEDMMRQAWE
jgi:probable 2-oxoglutarate dehydrogenase E1 component DHKTD1